MSDEAAESLKAPRWTLVTQQIEVTSVRSGALEPREYSRIGEPVTAEWCATAGGLGPLDGDLSIKAASPSPYIGIFTEDGTMFGWQQHPSIPTVGDTMKVSGWQITNA